MDGRFNAGPTTPEHSPRVSHLDGKPFDSDLVAICGIGLRLPSGIRTTDDYWDLLVNGKDARGPIPPTRYNIDGFSDVLGGKGAIKARYGYFLDDDLSTLDTSFFSMSRKEVERCDPQQRQLLEVVRECLDDAGEVNYRGQLVGCYVGTFGDDWLHIGNREPLHHGGYGYIATGNGDLFLANRVSYEYDFKGPSMVVKTGCSASLVALHEACRAVRAGDATSAIVAGTSLIMTPTITAAFTEEGILSPEGSCKTFDSSANGFARAEAITAVYVKPLHAALRDGNAIRAVVRATGTNSDGKSRGLLNPNGKAQEALMRKIYLDAGLDPSETAFVECHGTGTATGDPIEATAVGNVFGMKGVYIGSVKPNVGHSEGSSGLNSLIKCVLALERHIIPPNIKFCNPNPHIPFAEKGLRVPVEPTPFPSDRAKRISINSFGIGGTNAHVVIEAYHRPIELFPESVASPRTELLLLSANTAASLKNQIEKYQNFVREKSLTNSLDLAYTLAMRREKLPHRAFAVLQSGDFVSTSAVTKIPTEAPKIYLVFSGQGAQWPEMCKELLQSDRLFRRDIERMDNVLSRLIHPPAWTIVEELQKPSDISQISIAELSQPLCTAIQIALWNKLSAAGVRAAAVVGHSSGEIAAAYAAGAISMDAAIIIAYYRGYVTKKQTLSGAMAAIGLGVADVSRFLLDGLVVACENSPTSTTISGDREKILEAVAKIKQELPDVLARPLKVNMAYHSHQMVPLGQEYIQLLNEELTRLGIWSGFSSTTFVSSVTGDALHFSAVFGPDYWNANLTSPVLFSSAVLRLVALKGDGMFLEIGPHSTLAGPLRQICSSVSRPCLYTSSLTRGEDSMKSLLSAFGRLFQEAVPIDFTSFYLGAKIMNDLPTYSWDHSGSYWYESRLARDWRLRKFPHHCLLGNRVTESPDTAPQWRNHLFLEDQPWIIDHKVRKDIVFPFAGYIAMAGEAVRQMTGLDAGYAIRHAVAHTALVLSEARGTEMITTLRPQKLTDNDDSEWFEFSISSSNGSSWVKHFEGRVKASEESSPANLDGATYPRKVNAERYYDYMSDVGIVFGPEFRRLKNVSASATEQIAAAEIADLSAKQQAAFALHPAAMDACFQLLIMAQTHGLGRNFARLQVPTLIEELVVFRAGGNLTARAWGASEAAPSRIECASGNQLALRLSGFKMTPVEDGLDAELDVYAAARLEWVPDFDFVDAAPLFKAPESDREECLMLEEMTLLCIIESAKRLEGLAPGQPHFNKFSEWLRVEIAAAAAGTNRLVPHSAACLQLSSEARRVRIDELYEKLMKRKRYGLTRGIKRICDSCERIFTGEAEPIDILMQDGALAELYDAMSFGYSDFVRLLSSTQPTLRILEVGAGTGGTTELILRDLVHEGGLPRYSTYTFTDVSAGFFPSAKERFAYATNMEFKVFDITKCPVEQEFSPASYDLIIAANVVHATPSLKESLSNINKLLKPGGLLVLTEICTELRSPTYIFGNFIGWWLGENDGRPDGPYAPVERWDQDLRASGYTGVETAVYDEEAPYMICTTLMSRRVNERPELNRKVTLLSNNHETGAAKLLSDSLTSNGWAVTSASLGQRVPADQDIISCLDIEGNFFENIKQDTFGAFQDLLKSISTQNLLWLTSPVQIKCQDPRSAQAIGAARTIRSELAIPFYTFEIDPSEASFEELVLKVFGKIRIEEDDNNLVSDKEFVVNNGVICIGRYHPFSLTQELSERSASGFTSVKVLDIGKAGQIDSLYWKETAAPELSDDCVEIMPKAIGLNLRDILVAMGVISQDDPRDKGLGLETSGVVTAIGSKVTHLAVGDRVFAFAPNGALASSAVLQSHLVAKIPDDMSHEDAATVPVVFATVIQCLLNIARVEKGQSVLIHAACGGVGMAAIQVCKMVGAEIFATVGSDEKVEYLIKNFGIPPNRIFYSRNDSFVEGVMRETGNRGVDFVLNSLSGPLLHASWKCVAEFGMMLEIGKRDLLGHGQLDLRPFLGNRAYACFDGIEFARQRSDKLGATLATFLEGYKQGHLRPLPEVHTFKAAELEQAFRYLQNGSHIGKIVITSMGDLTNIPAKKAGTPLCFDPQASYLLTGGMGGLGKSMATWLVERGARSLTFLSRSAGISDESKEFAKELESMGCAVATVAGGAENMADVEAAIAASPTPIKGVFHLAMVLRDGPMIDMAWEEWDQVTKPKVNGAWNLHHALLEQPLDFFWLASSVITAVDQPGQGNYSASNTFLEALCQYRLGLGLPTAVLGICPIRGVGFVAESAVAQRNTKAQGIYSLGEREYLDYVELSILAARTNVQERSAAPSVVPPLAWKNDGQIVMGLRSELDLEDPNNRTNWRRDRRMGSYHNVRNENSHQDGGDGGKLKSFLGRAADDAALLDEKSSIEFLAKEIGGKVYDFLLKSVEEDIDISLSLSQMGLDSLMATELRRWFRQVLGLQISVLEIMGSGSLQNLGEAVAGGLKTKFAGKSG